MNRRCKLKTILRHQVSQGETSAAITKAESDVTHTLSSKLGQLFSSSEYGHARKRFTVRCSIHVVQQADQFERAFQANYVHDYKRMAGRSPDDNFRQHVSLASEP